MSDKASDSAPLDDSADQDDSEIADDAFIAPDEPIVRGDVPEDAFISPDEPILRKEEPSGAVAVGMSGREPTNADRSVTLDPTHVAVTLEAIARTIREEGFAAGLEVGPATSHFEAVMKAYLKGYFSANLQW